MSREDDLIHVRRGELENLRRWKAEALQVLKDWDKVFEEVDRVDPCPLAKSKAEHVLDFLTAPRFTGQVRDAGGRSVIILVDTDTEQYPRHGEHVLVLRERKK